MRIIYCKCHSAMTSAHIQLDFPVLKLKWRFYQFSLLGAVPDPTIKGIINSVIITLQI